MTAPDLVSFFEAYKSKLQKHRSAVGQHCAYLNKLRCAVEPVFGDNLVRLVSLHHCVRDIHTIKQTNRSPFAYSELLLRLVKFPQERAAELDRTIKHTACVITKARAEPVSLFCSKTDFVRQQHECESTAMCMRHSSSFDVFRSIFIRSQLSFPDKRLIQFDCGKLQALDLLLRKHKIGGHRALIFTQTTMVLDILEIFLSLYGYAYLRLIGSTKIEERHSLMDRFNNDNRIFIFILNTRSGGVGVNWTGLSCFVLSSLLCFALSCFDLLSFAFLPCLRMCSNLIRLFSSLCAGADTVIFYDTDWNPAMDRQARDRCHRIGQTREVHIYRLVAQDTVEENILKKANQKAAARQNRGFDNLAQRTRPRRKSIIA